MTLTTAQLQHQIAAIRNGQLDTSGNSHIDVLYLPDAGVIAIRDNAQTHWKDWGDGDEDGGINGAIDCWFNDQEEWQARR